jgi:DNA-binding transcriptional LysR family regulator
MDTVDPYLVTTIQSIRLPLYPDLHIKLQSHYSHELARMVAAGELDMALVTAIPDMPALDFLMIVERPFYVAFSKTNSLMCLHEVTLEDLHGVDWVLLASHVNPHAFERLQKAAAEKGITAAEMHCVMAIEEASAWILELDGVAILPRDAAWRIALDGITMRPLAEKDLTLATRLATRANNKSRLTSEFIRAIGRRQSTM